MPPRRSPTPAPVVIRNLGSPPEPPWLDAAVTALDALEDVRHGRRQEKLGGIVYKTVRACIEAYLRHFAEADTAPMLELTASELERWRVEVGVPRLDAAAGSRVLHAWHGVVTTLHASPNVLTAEIGDGEWVSVKLGDQHHDQSHTHRFWIEVSIQDAAGTHSVFRRRKDATVGLRELLSQRVAEAHPGAGEREGEAPRSAALAEVGGFLTSFLRNAGAHRLAAAHDALQQGRQRGWSGARIFLAVAVALATACGLWYWRVVHYTYSTPLVTRPLIDWGAPETTQAVLSQGERVGYVAYNHVGGDVIRLRYFRERTAWCPIHHMVKEMYTWRLSKNGREFYNITTRGTPWCEIKHPGLSQGRIGVTVELNDGAEVSFKTTRGGVVDITPIQREREEPIVIVTTTEDRSDPPTMTGALAKTTQEMRQPERPH